MFERIVIGVDGGQGGRDAIALANHLRKDQAQVILVHVFPGERWPSRGSSPPYEAAREEEAIALLGAERDQTRVEAELRAIGSPAVGRGLHVLAEALGADLLVVGSSQRGLLGRVFLGDDTQRALTGAPSAVAIAPTGYALEPSAMREIGVGYNESPESEHALAVARRLASQVGARLSVFEAVAMPAATFKTGALSMLAEVERRVAETQARLAELGDVEAHAVYGLPAEELAVYSASVDLLVVGSRDYGPLGRLMHGSVARGLARSARSPLLVLTRAARAAHLGLDEPVTQGVAD